MARTLSEILKDADKATELHVLIKVWNEIANNKYKYPLCQIWFANEHISNLISKVKGTDNAKNNFYNSLNKMNKC